MFFKYLSVEEGCIYGFPGPNSAGKTTTLKLILGLLKQLNREHGITILISSHLLAEVEKVATHIGIIHRGTMRFEGALSDLQGDLEGTFMSLVT